MLDIRQGRTVILEKGETNKIKKKGEINEVSPANASVWMVSSHSAERGNPSRAQRSSWVQEMDLRIQGAQGLHWNGKSSRDLKRVPLESSTEYSSAHTCKETIQG